MVRETAAAAIAVREGANGTEVCVVQPAEGQTSVPWALVAKGEVPKQTALRALGEASGAKATLGDVDPRFYKTIEQVYRKGIDKVRREVHLYKVKVQGDCAGTWLPAEEAAKRITSKSVREVVQAALGLAPPPAPAAPKEIKFDED